MRKDKNVKFARIRGRIVPIRSKGSKNQRALRDITSSKNAGSAAKIAAATAAGLGGLFASGKIQKKSNALLKAKSFKKAGILNRIAKFSKFSSKALPALVIGSAMTSIDKKSRDEGTAFDIGSGTGAKNIAMGLVSGYAFARFGKRFEKFGLRGGKFPVKLRDI